ncbi:TPA: hypothetical protein RQK97_004291 [Vibrio vulnificus]|uniref:hypothetical protein n=1 Tax=Vibrio vulnificus TaxID=672 RepID=UPI001FAD7068|nr:hypothetical protein [Vibrio vulnificus]MCJ0824265.1 hypothetical protein [Vibrio vulnificus]HDY8109249.1 hypothetical protein [Vibrio vulnificus]
MESFDNVIESACTTQITYLFGVLVKALANSDEESQADAVKRFRRGLLNINHAKYLALKAGNELPIMPEMNLDKELRFIEIIDDMFVECGICGGKVDLRTGKCPCDFNN